MPDDEKKSPTRDQKRAIAAFEAIEAVNTAKDQVQEYGRQCLRLPILIQQDGLCQTLAFLEAKSKKRYYERLCADFLAVVGVTAEDVRECDAAEYQRMSREALRVALWFKRYAEAVLRVSPEQDKRES